MSPPPATRSSWDALLGPPKASRPPDSPKRWVSLDDHRDLSSPAFKPSYAREPSSDRRSSADQAKRNLAGDFSQPQQKAPPPGEAEAERIRQLGEPYALAPEDPPPDATTPAGQKPLRFLNPTVAAPFFTAIMLERNIPIQWPESTPEVDELGEAGYRTNRTEKPRPFIPLLSHFRKFCDTLTSKNQPGPRRLPWVERTLRAAPEIEKKYFRPAPVPEEAWPHMQYDAGTWANPDRPPPAGVEGGSGSAARKERPHRVAPWNQKRDAELGGLETLARDGMRLANASLLTFAHLMNGCLDPAQSRMSTESRHRTLYTLRDLTYCTGEHLCRLAHQLAHLRKINATNALNLLNPQQFIDTPIGPDLFGGEFKRLHDEDVANKKAKAARERQKDKKKGSGNQGAPAQQQQQQNQPFRNQDRKQDQRNSSNKGQSSQKGNNQSNKGNRRNDGGGGGSGFNKGGRSGGGGGGRRGHAQRRK